MRNERPLIMKSRKILGLLLAVTVLMTSGCQQQATEANPQAMTEDQKAIYSYGAAIGQQVGQQARQLQFTPEELAIFQKGFTDTLGGKPPAVEIADFEERFQTLAEGRLQAAAIEAQKKGTEYLASAAREPGAIRTDSGLVFRSIAAGSGAQPKAADTVRVHYEGRLTDGTIFDSSLQRGEPAEFPLDRVIPCWTEGVQLMKVGEKAQLVCPSDIAYGERGSGTVIPPSATLVFEVELLGIQGQ